MLEILNLTKKFNNNTVLDNISLQINNNEIIGLVGKNGAGKSTLINCIVNPSFITSGSVKYNNETISKKDYLTMGIMFQEAFFDPFLKMQEMCKIMSKLYNVDYNYTLRLIEKFQLTDCLEKYTKNLSGGQKQKLNIIFTIFHNPKFIIFDELTTGLDSESRIEIYKILLNLKQSNKSMLIISHYYEELDNLCDKVYKLDNKKINLIYDKEIHLNILPSDILKNKDDYINNGGF